MIGQRLKLARSAAGLSLRDLESTLAGLVSAQAIGNYERDEMMPGSEVLLALSKALGVSEDYLLRDDAVELVGVEFRKQHLSTARERDRVQAKILSAVERYLEVEDLLALQPSWNAPSGFPKHLKSVDEAEQAATELRKAWQLGSDPIPCLTELLEEKGVKIVGCELDNKVSGVNAKVKRRGGDEVQVIVLNTAHSGERQRFTLAHELGHLLLTAAAELIEDVCNRFAGALLLPAEVLQKEIGVRRTEIFVRELFLLKQTFGVSAQAVAYRCADLGIFGEPLKRSIFQAFGKNGWRKKEPNPLPAEQPNRFMRLCLRALSECVISESKAAELLSIKPRALRAMLDTPAG